MENQPGNGSTSPFGNEQGATSAGGGASSGAHDFTEDPKSHSPASGGRDFTKENRPQPAGGTSGYNPQSVPAGGTTPFSGEPKPLETGPAKPFKLGGEPAPEAPAPMAGEAPSE